MRDDDRYTWGQEEPPPPTLANRVGAALAGVVAALIMASVVGVLVWLARVVWEAAL